MKLAGQLTGIALGSTALYLLSVGTYFGILSPLDHMEQEAKAINEMALATGAVEIQSELLVLRPFGDQIENYRAAMDRFLAAEKAIEEITVLPRATPTLSQAVLAVVNSAKLAESSLDLLSANLADLRGLTRGTGLDFDSATWSTLQGWLSEGKVEDPDQLIGLLPSKVVSLDSTFSLTREVVEQKDGEISLQLKRLRELGAWVGLLIVALTSALSLGLSLALARHLSKAVGHLARTVALVTTGDLRGRVESVRNDELGCLGRDLDTFLDSLGVALGGIQAASAQNLEVKDRLISSTADATSSAIEIEASSSSILAQLQKADGRIQASLADLESVVVHLDALLERLNDQGTTAQDSSRSVSELVVGIRRISELSTQNRRAVGALLSTSDTGRSVFERSGAKVGEIMESVSDIQDLVGSIAELASQTNILALNAAIEAAHAGEAGKGFAVVSDEIGKLAAASAEASAQISRTIEQVVEKIRGAGDTRQETLDAFDAISTQIGLVSDHSQEIDAETHRMNLDTDRIRGAMDSLSSSSTLTKSQAQQISGLATQLDDAFRQVGRVSHEVVSHIGEISIGLAEITRTVVQVQSEADRLGAVGAMLDRAVNAFSLDDPGSG